MARGTVFSLLAVLLASLHAVTAQTAANATAMTGKNATAAAATTLTSISPPKLTVNLKFMIDGEMTDLTSCTSDKLNDGCLPKVQAERDAVFVSYNVMDGQTPNLTDKVLLKACYSNFSQVDRPWRKTNNIIAKSKKCPITIAKGLSPSNATDVEFEPNEHVATATYFVRAYVIHNSSSTTSYPVAFGNSQGYFQMVSVDSRPRSMKIAAGICACVGPLMFLVYFFIQFYKKKHI